jgi:Tol biopolymer transport system component
LWSAVQYGTSLAAQARSAASIRFRRFGTSESCGSSSPANIDRQRRAKDGAAGITNATILHSLDLPPQATILDLGCGPGAHAIAIGAQGYASDESGAYQVYVRPFPGPGARFQISTDGGEMPVWSRDGRHLYFITDRAIALADLAFSPSLSVTRRAQVIEGDFAPLSRGHASYDVMPDGRSLLLTKPVNDAQTMIVLNWATELRDATGRAPGR